MFVKDHIVRVENIKSIQKLDAAGIDHKVIALFLSCEGIAIQPNEIGAKRWSHLFEQLKAYL